MPRTCGATDDATEAADELAVVLVGLDLEDLHGDGTTNAPAALQRCAVNAAVGTPTDDLRKVYRPAITQHENARQDRMDAAHLRGMGCNDCTKGLAAPPSAEPGKFAQRWMSSARDWIDGDPPRRRNQCTRIERAGAMAGAEVDRVMRAFASGAFIVPASPNRSGTSIVAV
jgi:hypothetical protein